MYKFQTAGYQEIGLTRAQPIEIERRAGYLFNNNLIHGVYLLSQRNFGKELLYRLKSSKGVLLDEIDFWAGAMASMIESFEEFDCVSYPPTSHPDTWYLAKRLAEVVADIAGLPVHDHFRNDHPRNTKCSMAAKLHEKKGYRYTDGEFCDRVLMVDDAVTTRKTAEACISAVGNRSLFWLFLYASKSDKHTKFIGKVEGVECTA